MATYYRPSGDAEVGGDFYDAVPLDNRQVAVFIGDVMGHGVPAAAAMAHIRAAVRAYLCIDPEPSHVVSKLDAMFARLDIRQLVTLVYAVLDDAKLHFVNAGHHLPLLLPADGHAAFVNAPRQRLLGAGGQSRHTATVAFEPGSTLLLYTDGLVEQPGEPIDLGLHRLTTHAPTLLDGPLPDALSRLAGDLLTASGHDDTTAMALRKI